MGNLQKNGSYTEISSSTIQVITFNSSPNWCWCDVIDVTGAYLKAHTDPTKNENLFHI
jgi:hypothetical protein